MKILVKVLLILAAVSFLSSCNEKKPEEHSLEQLIPQARLNFAHYEISRVYSVCPSRMRKYLVAFRTSVRFDLDLNKSPMAMKKNASGTGYTIYVPAIEIDESVGVKPYSKLSWVLNSGLLTNDAAEAEKQKEHVEAYSLYLASQKLGSDEVNKMFESRIKELVKAIALGAGKTIEDKDIAIEFAKTVPKTYEMPKELKLCENGQITW